MNLLKLFIPYDNPYWNKDLAKALELDRREELLKIVCEPDPATVEMMKLTAQWHKEWKAKGEADT